MPQPRSHGPLASRPGAMRREVLRTSTGPWAALPSNCADHREQQRERECGGEVDTLRSGPASATSSRRPSTICTRRRRPSTRCLVSGDTSRRSRGVGGIDVEHVVRERGPGKALGHHVAGARQGGLHVLGQPSVVEGGRAPRRSPTPTRRRARRPRSPGTGAEAAGLGEDGERVVQVVVAPPRAPDGSGSDVMRDSQDGTWVTVTVA